MSAVTITGARGTGNVSSAQQKPDINSVVLELEPNEYPFTVLTKQLRKKATHNADFSWFEDTLEPRTDAINNGAGYSTSATSVVVDNGSYFAQYDVVRVLRTGEVFRVTAVSTNTLTVVRGVGNGGTGIAILDNDELVIIGSAQPEGDTSKPARSGNPTQVTNYAQIFRTSIEHTETMRHTDTWTTPGDPQRTKAKKGIEHMKSLEYAFLMGKPAKDTSGSQPMRFTGGAMHFITTNVTAAGGTLSESAFFTWARSAFRYGSKTKLLLASRLLVDVLNTYARGKVQVADQGRDTYGVRIFKFISPHGDINMVTHDLLEGPTLGGYGILLDLQQIQYRPLQNSEGSRDTDLLENRQARDADTQKSEYLTEAGEEFGLEKTHALLTGVSG